jgi:hypothetical protein
MLMLYVLKAWYQSYVIGSSFSFNCAIRLCSFFKPVEAGRSAWETSSVTGTGTTPVMEVSARSDVYHHRILEGTLDLV